MVFLIPFAVARMATNTIISWLFWRFFPRLPGTAEIVVRNLDKKEKEL